MWAAWVGGIGPVAVTLVVLAWKMAVHHGQDIERFHDIDRRLTRLEHRVGLWDQE